MHALSCNRTALAALLLALCAVAVPGQQPERPLAVAPDRPALATSVLPTPLHKPNRDLSQLPLFVRQVYLSTQRGNEWLLRANRPDGRFLPGLRPALRTPLESESYLQQVEAAWVVARTARFFQDERGAAIARQALLTLLLDTVKNARQQRHTTFPSTAVSRLAAASWLILAIHELPSPGADLLEQAEELTQYLQAQQRADGSFRTSDDTTGADAPEAISQHTGIAVYALLRSQQHKSAAWKLDGLRKACAFYVPYWRQHKDATLAAWHGAAYAEAFLLTREQAFADAATALADWLCDLQYLQVDPRRATWIGGFMSCKDGKPDLSPPDARSAAYAEGLAKACQLAKTAGDVRRYQCYRETLERLLHYLARLQYTEASAQHFASWYRPEVLGGYHTPDGTIRLDCTAHAVNAMLRYLQDVAEVR